MAEEQSMLDRWFLQQEVIDQLLVKVKTGRMLNSWPAVTAIAATEEESIRAFTIRLIARLPGVVACP